MLTIATQILAQTNQTIDIQVSITAVAGSPGIFSAQVMGFDQAGGQSSFATQTPGDCPSDLSFIVKGIPVTSIPLYVEAYECMTGVDVGQGPTPTTWGPFFGEPLVCKPMGQNIITPTCSKLKNEIQTMRINLMIYCTEFADQKSKRDALGVGLTVAVALASALTAAAASAGFPIAVAILAVLAALAWGAVVGLSFLLAQAQSTLNSTGDIIHKIQLDLKTLIGRLPDVCCFEFIGMNDLPTCPT